MSKRSHGDGGIDARGPNTWRLRYRIKGKLGRSDGSSIPFDKVGEIDLAGLGGN